MTVIPPLRAASAALLATASIAASEAGASGADTADVIVTRAGSVPSMRGGVPQNFTGDVRVDMLHVPKAPWSSSAAHVTFEPGARTVWHTHPVGQVLIVTAGVGLVQKEGGAAQTIRPGDSVWIPPDVKHWHGATPTSGMTHLAITESRDGRNVEWLEPVSDAQYAR